MKVTKPVSATYNGNVFKALKIHHRNRRFGHRNRLTLAVICKLYIETLHLSLQPAACFKIVFVVY
ncbi:MAG: hypothetical protein ABIG64_08090 [Candidatus Omnitrophota bacterium]